jgi:hypothetical protein
MPQKAVLVSIDLCAACSPPSSSLRCGWCSDEYAPPLKAGSAYFAPVTLTFTGVRTRADSAAT